MNELRDLKTIQKALQEVLNPFERILKVKAGKPQALGDLRKTIGRVPTGSVAGRALDEVRRDLAAWVK